jgi:hypothetical protein
MDVTNQEMFTAARDGKWTLELRQACKMMKGEINRGDKNGVTILHMASWNGNLVIVKELLSLEHIDPSVTDSFGRSVLHAAILGHKSTEHPIAAYSGNSNYQVENQTYFKDSPPDSEDRLEIIEIFLRHRKIDVNRRLDGFSPLYLAVVANHHPGILERVLTAPEITRSGQDCHLTAVEAVLNDDKQTLELLDQSAHRINFNYITQKNFSLVGLALWRDKVRCLQFLLDHEEVDVNCMGKSEMRKELVKKW